MKEILDLINTVNKNLSEQNILPTPSNYEKEFFKLLENSDILLEDYVEFNDIKSSLNEREKDNYKYNEIESFQDLAKILKKRIPDNEIRQFLKHLSYYMSPSIKNKEIKSDIYEACTDIAKSPKELIDIDNIRKLRKITNSRIFSDKYLFNEKTSDVKKLIIFLDEHFKKIINENSLTLETICDIKNDLSSINLSESSSQELILLQDRLLDVTKKIECSLEQQSCELENSQNECSTLQEQIQELQENLEIAEKEKSIDYLTGILTRRAYDIEVDRVENEYQIFDSNYALVFFDIDYFKKINDSYGHDCGDAVLSTFAKILKKLTRTEDIITRYGGEEFISIIHYKNILEVTNYLSRAKNIITENKFIYKDLKLNVQFSAGVAFRKNYNNYEELIKASDKLLYEAKNSGRNKIILDNGTVL